MRKSNELSTSDFDDSGVVTTPHLGRVDMASINITDGKGKEYFIEGFDYVVRCSVGLGVTLNDRRRLGTNTRRCELD